MRLPDPITYKFPTAKFVPIVALVSLASIAHAQGVEAELSARLKKLHSEIGVKNSPDLMAEVAANRERVNRLLAKDLLKTPAEFELAAQIATDPRGFYENQRQAYEFQLVSYALGKPTSADKLMESWDRLQLSLGFGQRFGTVSPKDMEPAYASALWPMAATPAPVAIKTALSDLAAARAKAASSKNNEELAKLVAADQNGRTEPPKSKEDVMKRIQADIDRLNRVKELLETDALATAEDFSNAGLIMQHGRRFTDYAAAHECGMVCLLLNGNMGKSLCSVSYDRMLLSAGHRQRFGTQLGQTEYMDSTGISPKMKEALWVLN